MLTLQSWSLNLFPASLLTRNLKGFWELQRNIWVTEWSEEKPARASPGLPAPCLLSVIDYLGGGSGIHPVLSELPAKSVSSDPIRCVCYSYLSVHFHHPGCDSHCIGAQTLWWLLPEKVLYITNLWLGNQSHSYPYLNLLSSTVQQQEPAQLERSHV